MDTKNRHLVRLRATSCSARSLRGAGRLRVTGRLGPHRHRPRALSPVSLGAPRSPLPLPAPTPPHHKALPPATEKAYNPQSVEAGGSVQPVFPGGPASAVVGLSRAGPAGQELIRSASDG